MDCTRARACGFYAEAYRRNVLSLVLSALLIAIYARSTVLVFGGDIMLNGIRPSPKVFAGILDLTSHSDLTFGNLEIPLTDSRTRTSRKSAMELKARTQWILKANPLHAPFLSQANIGAVSLANNHAMDYGQAGLAEMCGLLDGLHIAHAGAGVTYESAMSPATVSLTNGKKVALISAMAFVTGKALFKTTPATDSSAGVATLNLAGRIDDKARAKLSDWIASARKGADIVVVAMHWGVERKGLPIPYQVALGRALIDCGADIVWGNHPHVLQGAETYRRKLIMYSMGNMISSLPAVNGFFRVTASEDGTLSPEFVPARVRGGRVAVDPARFARAGWLSMRGLCRSLLHRYPNKNSKPALF